MPVKHYFLWCIFLGSKYLRIKCLQSKVEEFFYNTKFYFIIFWKWLGWWGGVKALFSTQDQNKNNIGLIRHSPQLSWEECGKHLNVSNSERNKYCWLRCLLWRQRPCSALTAHLIISTQRVWAGTNLKYFSSRQNSFILIALVDKNCSLQHPSFNLFLIICYIWNLTHL